MSKKRAPVQAEKSTQKTVRQTADFTVELARTKDEMHRLRERLDVVRERCHQNESDYTERLQFEELLADISGQFVNLPTDRTETAIADAQRRFCDFLVVDQCIIWQTNDNEPIRMIMYHVQQPANAILPESPLDMGDIFPWILDQVMRGKIVNVADRQKDLPPEADRDRASLKSLGVKSTLVLPLLDGGKTIGAVSFGRLKEKGDWPERILKRMYLVAQLFTNVLTRKRSEELLESRQRFESLVADISAHFVNLPAEQIDSEIEDAHRRICECLGVELSGLWQWSNKSPTSLTVTHLFGPPEAHALAEKIEAREAFPWVLERVLRGEVVVLPTAKMPLEAARDEASRRQFGAKSSLAIPLSVGGGPILGVLDFNILKEERTWPAPVVARLQVIAQLFANVLARKEADEELEFRRRLDALVTDISTQFVNLPTDQIDTQIEDAQRRICECLDVDLSALWQWSDSSPHFLTVTHLHSPPEGPERPVGIDAREAFPWILERVLRGEVLVHATETLPSEATRDQESLRHFGVQSSVVIPLSAGGGPVIGCLTFDTLKEVRTWEEPVVRKLLLIAQLFANTLARRRSELESRESRIRMNMATESAGVGLWVMEADTGSVWVTPRTRKLFRFAEDEALDYASFDQKIFSADRHRVEQAVKAAIDSGEPLDIDFRIVHTQGNHRWIRARGRQLSADNGKAARLMGASIDITDRKQMEDQLRTQLNEISSLKQQLEKENILLRKEIDIKNVHEEIVVRSAAMCRVLDQVEQVAPTDATVLIQGETGTGKDLIARAVHQLSTRKKRALVVVNCASLPPTLIESELFGREKGAYTGALTRMTGRFEAADGATLFLDEIGELPVEVQAKLLRVLEQGCFERLGSTTEMKVDVRIIAATNKDLEKQVATGKFRKDLYYRLNVFPILLPPLRERPNDIPPLVWAFVRQYEKKMGKRIDHITPQTMDELQRCNWPGNARELRNVIERALITCSGRTLEVHPPLQQDAKTRIDLNLEEMERRHITDVLEQTGWRLSGQGGAAEILGLKRTTLYAKMKRLGIHRPA
jgi:formate hydrogenlyase transcriptional activator